MGIPSQQIGWSQKAKLLWNIAKQLETLTQVAGNIQIAPATTTTTTTAPAGSTEYLILRLTAEPTIFPSAFPSTGFACASWGDGSFSFYSVYAAESSIGSITYLYTDIGLTTPVVNTSPSVAYNTIAVPSGLSYTTPYTLQISGGAGQVSNLVACP